MSNDWSDLVRLSSGESPTDEETSSKSTDTGSSGSSGGGGSSGGSSSGIPDAWQALVRSENKGKIPSSPAPTPTPVPTGSGSPPNTGTSTGRNPSGGVTRGGSSGGGGSTANDRSLVGAHGHGIPGAPNGGQAGGGGSSTSGGSGGRGGGGSPAPPPAVTSTSEYKNLHDQTDAARAARNQQDLVNQQKNAGSNQGLETGGDNTLVYGKVPNPHNPNDYSTSILTKSEAASRLEKRWLANHPGFSPADVRVVESGGRFMTELTSSGVAKEQSRARGAIALSATEQTGLAFAPGDVTISPTRGGGYVGGLSESGKTMLSKGAPPSYAYGLPRFKTGGGGSTTSAVPSAWQALVRSENNGSIPPSPAPTSTPVPTGGPAPGVTSTPEYRNLGRKAARGRLDAEVDKAAGMNLTPGVDYTVSTSKNNGQTSLEATLTRAGEKKVFESQTGTKATNPLEGALFDFQRDYIEPASREAGRVAENVGRSAGQFTAEHPAVAGAIGSTAGAVTLLPGLSGFGQSIGSSFRGMAPEAAAAVAGGEARGAVKGVGDLAAIPVTAPIASASLDVYGASAIERSVRGSGPEARFVGRTLGSFVGQPGLGEGLAAAYKPNEKSQAGQVAAETGAAAGAAAVGAAGYVATHPFEAGGRIGANLIGGYGVARGASAGAEALAESRVPTPSVERFALGESRGVTFGLKRVIEGQDRPIPVTTVASRTAGRTPLEFGVPDVPLTAAESAGPELSGTETLALQKAFRTVGDEGASSRIGAFRGTQRFTKASGLKPEELQPIIGDVLESHGVTREAAPSVVEAIKSDQATVYGSMTQKVAGEQVGEPGLARTPGDIDVGDLTSKEAFAKTVTDRINAVAGENVVRLEEGTPTSTLTGKKIFDLHQAGEESTAFSPGPHGGKFTAFGVRTEPNVQTSEGLATTTLSEQAARKAQGAMKVVSAEPRQVGMLESRLAPVYEGRLKDIPDYYLAEKGNIAALELAGKTRAAAKASTHLESFVDTFSPEIASWTRSEYQRALAGQAAEAGSLTVALADFSSPTVGVEAPTTRGAAIAPSLAAEEATSERVQAGREYSEPKTLREAFAERSSASPATSSATERASESASASATSSPASTSATVGSLFEPLAMSASPMVSEASMGGERSAVASAPAQASTLRSALGSVSATFSPDESVAQERSATRSPEPASVGSPSFAGPATPSPTSTASASEQSSFQPPSRSIFTSISGPSSPFESPSSPDSSPWPSYRSSPGSRRRGARKPNGSDVGKVGPSPLEPGWLRETFVDLATQDDLALYGKTPTQAELAAAEAKGAPASSLPAYGELFGTPGQKAKITETRAFFESPVRFAVGGERPSSKKRMQGSSTGFELDFSGFGG